MGRLANKVALISGGADGIGAATARAFVAAGACVMIADIRQEAGKETAATLGESAAFVSLDVKNEAEWESAVAATEETFGKLDVLVNNAGVFLGKDFEDASLDDWQRLIDVNLTGVFLGTKCAAPALRRSGAKSAHGSAIVNLSSVAGLVGSLADPLYSMTKGGVTLFTKSAALSFARKGDRIRVNSVHPGVIETSMGARALARRTEALGATDHNASVKSTHPIGRMGTPEDVADTIVFLASDDSRFMTGSSLVVDGGLTAQ